MSKEHKPLRLVKRNATLAKKTKEQKEALLIQLAKYPILQTACDKADVGRSTYYLWRKDDDEFRRRADDALNIGKEFICDMAESQLIKAIQNGNITALIYWLKNHHPDYCDKILHRYEIAEQTVTEEESLQIARALTHIGLASTLRRETRDKLDEMSKEQKQKESAIANARNEGLMSQEKLENTVIKIGNAKPTTIKAHLDSFEEEERIRKAKISEDYKNRKIFPKRTGVNLKEFFKKHLPKS